MSDPVGSNTMWSRCYIYRKEKKESKSNLVQFMQYYIRMKGFYKGIFPHTCMFVCENFPHFPETKKKWK